ncbi:MAG: glycosyltransferase [Verrucomicrobiota bacterium]|nr:glycosyltransferase [Verrucomicrobiota bacterium]
MRLVFLSHLYPNSAAPNLAPYNRQLIGALARKAEVRVVAPVFTCPAEPWFRRRAIPPVEETLAGLRVAHPRVFRIPGCLAHRHWRSYRKTVAPCLENLARDFRPDHVMIGFAYPDGVAAAPLCRAMAVRHSIRINGSDFRIRVRQPRFRDMVLDMLREAPLVLCPGHALKHDLEAEGVHAERIVAFQNGVDARLFRHRSANETLRNLAAAMGDWGGDRIGNARMILYVGHLTDGKRVEAILRALALLDRMSKCVFVAIGDGPLRGSLERRAARLGIAQRVVFRGARPHEEVARWMNAADCLCLPSRSEGMPNVVVEALASGLPVVASDVGEVSFLVRNGKNGFVVKSGVEGFAGRLAEAIRACLGRSWDRERIATEMRSFTWEAAAERVLDAITEMERRAAGTMNGQERY